MKTKKQVLEDYPQHTTLINAVIRRIGMDSVEDVINHGADSGFNGFIYYADTHAFAMRHRKVIYKLLHEQADMFDMDTVSMITSFGVFRSWPVDKEDLAEIYKYLGGGRCEHSNVTNVIAWFALEEVCRMFED